MGPTGSICQIFNPDAARKSMNRSASAPSSPMPFGPGREVGCSRTPDARGNMIEWVGDKWRSGLVEQAKIDRNAACCNSRHDGVLAGSSSQPITLEILRSVSSLGSLKRGENVARARRQQSLVCRHEGQSVHEC